MGYVLNTEKVINRRKSSIDKRYDLYTNNVNDIREMSPEPIDMVHNSFIFGYAQGHKAAKAEMKEAGWKNPNKVTVAELIETLSTLDQESIVLNYWDRNIKVYPGRENKSGGKPIVKLC